ncbi:MAG TPA: PDZ domain-containing protein [Ferruginibacter sp.]|nr:PDZ domain-containing protein [Ferruginibacter sp.]
MKKIILVVVPWFFAAFSYKAIAQDDVKEKVKENKKETQEIVIRKTGDKDANITVQINGDKVLINGKPMSEFRDDGITVHNRKMTVKDGSLFSVRDGMGVFENFSGGSKVFLGVSTEKTEEGAKITQITKESPAEKAGLKKGDVITRFEEKNIDGPQALYDAVNDKKAKEDVKVTFKREGKEQTVKATLQERKNDGMKTFSYSTPDGNFKSFSIPNVDMVPDAKTFPKIQQWHDVPGSGYDFDNNGMSFTSRPKLGLKIQDTDDDNGVKVLEVDNDSPSAKSGIKKDDVIIEIGGVKVSNTDEAREQLRVNSSKAAYSIKAKRNGSTMNFDIKIPKKLKTANL